MNAMQATAARWITAADGDRKRHLVNLDGDHWRALCGTTFADLDTRHVIPRRCLPCLDEAQRQGIEIEAASR